MEASPTSSPRPLVLGGMALRNGLLIHGPTSWSAAVRSGGEIVSGSGRKPRLAPAPLARSPMLRGPIRLAEAIAVLPVVRASLAQARLPFEDRSTAAAIAISLGGASVARRIWGGGGRGELIAQLIGAAPALIGLRDRDLAAYHGVEHKVIAAHEQGSDDASSMPKEHDRCGSNLVVPMLALSVAGSLIVERLLDRPGPIARGGAAIAAASIAVEMFAYSDRHPDRAFARGFHGLGHEIQARVATAEPTPEQMRVGERALELIVEAEGTAAGADAPGEGSRDG